MTSRNPIRFGLEPIPNISKQLEMLFSNNRY